MSLFRLTFRFLSKNHHHPHDLSKGKSPVLFAQKNLTSNYGGFTMRTANISQWQQKQQQQQFQQQRNFSVLITRHNAMAVSERARNMTTQELTKNMQLFTEEPRNVDKEATTLKLKNPLDKPLVMLFSWLQAKQKHLSKYAKIYIEQGFDVLVIQITPWQLLWPVKGTQLVAYDVVTFLKNNPTINPILLHGFSVGGYLWGECLVHMARDMENCKSVIDRICGQIWDSAADITEIPIGVPKALFPKNLTMQKALRKYMLYHMKTFHEPATSHYIRSSQMFHSNLVKKPALLFLSKTDPVGAVSSNERLRENWDANGINVTWKCWDRSPHVGHFTKHKDEYLQYLFNHLQSLNLLQNPEKIRAKL